MIPAFVTAQLIVTMSPGAVIAGAVIPPGTRSAPLAGVVKERLSKAEVSEPCPSVIWTLAIRGFAMLTSSWEAPPP